MKKLLIVNLIILAIVFCGCPESKPDVQTVDAPDVINIVDQPAGDDEEPTGEPAPAAAVEETLLYPIHIMEDGIYYFGFMNRSGEVVIDFQYTEVSTFSEGLAAVAIGFHPDIRFGFINASGEMVIEPQFPSVSDFHDGRANVSVWTDDDHSDTLIGYIDVDGNFAIEPQYYYARDFSEGVAFVQSDDFMGFIDKTGLQVIWTGHGYGDFIEGLAVSLDALETSYINHDGDVVLTIQYDNTRHFKNGLAPVMSDGIAGFINTEGEEVIPLQYVGVTEFSDGYAMVSDFETWVRIDTEGNVVMQTEFLPAGPFSEGLAPFVREPGEGMGYMDEDGEVVIDTMFDMAQSFTNGLALVRWDNSYGYIDTSGNYVYSYDYPVE